LKNIQTQELQETIPSIAPPNGTFLLNDPETVICGKKNSKNDTGK